MSIDMRATLETWLELGWIRAVDLQFAKHLTELALSSKNQASEKQAGEKQFDDQQPSLLLLILSLLSHQVGRGHVCVDLPALCNNPSKTLALPPQDRRYSAQQRELLKHAQALTPEKLLESLSPEIITTALREVGLAAKGNEVTPLVLSGERLYMRRYWLYETQIATAIHQRLELRNGLSDPNSDASKQVKLSLERLFPQSEFVDYQRAACALAARTRFSLITGGPGTGKTTTVIRLLALLQSLAPFETGSTERKYQIELAAPTGKAAARLNESIRSAIDKLPFDAFDGQLNPGDLPTKVRTLHRLLGSRRYSREFRHNSDNPLPLDVLVIDEASMVDVSMLAAVVAALPKHAQLILIGDQDQLASVEAGSVLGELCSRSRAGHYQPATRAWLQAVAGITLPTELEDANGSDMDQAVAMLRHSYRFDASSGIGRLAQAINAGKELSDTLTACTAGEYDDIQFLKPTAQAQENRTESLLRLIAREASAGYSTYLTLAKSAALNPEQRNSSAKAILLAYTQYQLLTPVRQGDFGVSELNHRITAQLHQQRLIDSATPWYHGRPIMVSANDYNVGLMNGDIGICLQIEDRPLVAFMPDDAEGEIRWIPPSRLPAHETVFAMTVHKSQGSEFAHCALAIPPQDSPVLTRELIYTAVTRSRSHFSLISENPQSLIQITQRRTDRTSGLGSLLFGGADYSCDDRTKQAISPAPDSSLPGDGQLDLF